MVTKNTGFVLQLNCARTKIALVNVSGTRVQHIVYVWYLFNDMNENLDWKLSADWQSVNV